MQLQSTFNKGFRFLLCAIDICSKYAWVIPLKDKKGVTIANAFQNILKNLIESQIKYGFILKNGYSNNIEMHNNIEMYSIHNEGKSVAAERFTRTSVKFTKYDFNVTKYKNIFAKGYIPNWSD